MSIVQKGLRCNYFWQAPLGRPDDSTTPSKTISYKKYHKETYSKSNTTKIGYLLCVLGIMPINLHSATLWNGYYYYKCLRDRDRLSKFLGSQSYKLEN